MRRTSRLQGAMPSRLILFPVVVATVTAVSACDTLVNGDQVETFGADQAQYAAVCTDLRDRNNPDDDVRVDDDQCGEDDEDGNATNGGFSFIWIDLGNGRNHTVPAYGQTVPRALGSTTHPKGAVVMKKLPPTGFTSTQLKTGAVKSSIQRGGLGVTGKGATSSGG